MEMVQLSKEQKIKIRKMLDENLAEIKSLQSPFEVHVVAANWNWDWNYADKWETLKWIISNSICDKGTSLLLYWRAAPMWLYQFSTRHEVPQWAHSNYDFVKEVEQKYLSGFYTTEEIAFDPCNDEGINRVELYSDVSVSQIVPDQMKQAIAGVKIDRRLTL